MKINNYFKLKLLPPIIYSNMTFWSLCWCKWDDVRKSGPETIYRTLDDAIMAAISSVSKNLYQTPDGTMWYCNPKEIKRNKGIKLKVLKRVIKMNMTFDPTDPWDEKGILTEFYFIKEVKLLDTPKLILKQVKELTNWDCIKCGRYIYTDTDTFDPETSSEICELCYWKESKNDPNSEDYEPPRKTNQDN
uniref:Uncharacterized protein n=1 Tax=Pithovirus LCPAC202 TaxID=2506592 RepID=A0A481Z7D5_9VIRU|nr:MAG: hypothetical protein LCPAC202_00230 [Pithovirus LCPAC202]